MGLLKKIVVGLTQRVDKVESSDEWRDAIDQRLIDWVVESGFMPVPIPNTLVDLTLSTNRQSNLDDWIKTVKINALLLSGGNNIGDVDQRDLTEKYLLSWAKKNKKPVLGICRGMQMMGVYSGGNLIEVNGHVKTRHTLHIKNNYRKLFPESVNSYHNLVLQGCPDLFQVLAESEDGHIEAIMHSYI